MTWRDDSGGIAARGRTVTGALTFGAWGAEQDVANVGNFGDIAIGPNGEVMVIYQTPTGNQGPSNIIVHLDADGTGAGLRRRRYRDRHERWRVRLRTRAAPALGRRRGRTRVGPHGRHRTTGAFYLVYTDENPDESNDFDIWVRRPTTTAPTGARPCKSTTTRARTLRCFRRSPWTRRTDEVAVTFLDRARRHRRRPQRDRHRRHCQQRRARCSRRGVTTAPRGRRTSRYRDAPTDGYNYNGAQELGDYTGSAFHGGILYPSWADASNSTGDNPERARANLDVYTAARSDPTTTRRVVTVAPASGAEGAAISLSGTATDADNDPLTYSWAIAP